MISQPAVKPRLRAEVKPANSLEQFVLLLAPEKKPRRKKREMSALTLVLLMLGLALLLTIPYVMSVSAFSLG